MITRKYYLIELVDRGKSFWLRRCRKKFQWNNHGQDKEYKNLGSAAKEAARIFRKLRHNDQQINVIEVTFRPCNPELPDGFYEPVKNVVKSFWC